MLYQITEIYIPDDRTLKCTSHFQTLEANPKDTKELAHQAWLALHENPTEETKKAIQETINQIVNDRQLEGYDNTNHITFIISSDNGEREITVDLINQQQEEND